MNKSEMIEAVAKSADISKAAAEKALDGALGAIKGALKMGSTVTLVGFGTFKVGKRAARTGRNPRTGAAVDVAQKSIPFFKTGKQLRDRLNGTT